MSFLQTSSIVLDNSTVTTAPTSSIELDKTTSSIILGRNLNTSPEYITISPNAISDGVNSTTLTNISQLSTALASVELPPNSTTLKIDNALLLSDGTNEALLDINSTNGNLDITTTGYVTLNNLPRCSDVPTNSAELVNKAYADSIVSTNATTVTLVDTNVNSTYYPMFGIGAGPGITPRVDVTSNPLTYNPFTGTLSSTNFNGTVNNIDVNNDNTAGTYYPVFVSGGTSGSKNLRMDSLTNALSYNPGTSTLSASTFVGNLSGNSSTSTTATTATNATNTEITLETSNSTFYPTFVSATTGNLPQEVSSGLTYNPSTNILSVGSVSATTFTGSLNGNSSSATTATDATNASNVNITSDNSNGTYYVPFTKTSGSGNKALFQDDTTGPLAYNPATSTLVASAFQGNLVGSASNIQVTDTNNDALYYPLFGNAAGVGISARADITNGSLTYNPSSGVLSSNTFVGNLNGNASTSTTSTTATNSTNVAVSLDSTNATYYPTFVSATTGNLPIDVNTNLSFNPSTGNLSATSFTGNFNGSITNSTNSTNVAVTLDSTNATYYPTFVSATTGNLPIDVNTNLSFNPSTGNLSATSFTGNFNGTITDSTNALNVNVTSDNTNATCWIPFTKTFGSGYKELFIDDTTTPLTYNPFSSTVFANNFTGALTGTASNAVTASNATNATVTDDNTNSTFYPVFVSGSATGSKALRMDSNSGPLTYNPSTGILTSTFSGNLSGNATSATNSTNTSNITVTSDNTAGTYYIPFVKTSGSGAKPLYFDDSSGVLSYNPSTRELTVARLTPNATDINAQLTLIERCLFTRIQNYGFSITSDAFAASANTNYAFYCGNDGQNNFNAPSQAQSGNTLSRINFCISDVKYMCIDGRTARLGNIGVRTADPDHPLDVVGNIRSTTSVLTPQVGNPDGNLNIRVNNAGVGGSLSITGGTGILSATAGGASGQHLVININGVNYKIALLNA